MSGHAYTQRTYSEWRFAWGERAASRSEWTIVEPTPEDVAEWSVDLTNVRVERRTVTIQYGPVEIVAP
jgi:hypothetical protein